MLGVVGSLDQRTEASIETNLIAETLNCQRQTLKVEQLLALIFNPTLGNIGVPGYKRVLEQVGLTRGPDHRKESRCVQ